MNMSLRFPEHSSLSTVLNGVKGVQVVSGTGLPESLPDQTFTIVDPLAFTRQAFGKNARLPRGWRIKVPPDVLAQIEREFPIEFDPEKIDLKAIEV